MHTVTTQFGGYYGAYNVTEELPECDNSDMFDDSSVTWDLCRECQFGGDPSIEILSVSLIGGDILDYSNATKLEEYAGDHWSPWVYIHKGASTIVCISIEDMEDIPAEIVADIIGFRESFDDYPVIDNEDYSAREDEAFIESFDYQTSQLTDLATGEPLDCDHALYEAALSYATDAAFGDSNISHKHVILSWREVGAEVGA